MKFGSFLHVKIFTAKNILTTPLLFCLQLEIINSVEIDEAFKELESRALHFRQKKIEVIENLKMEVEYWKNKYLNEKKLTEDLQRQLNFFQDETKSRKDDGWKKLHDFFDNII